MNKRLVNEFAPVIIPTLNRYEHLKRCITSLSNNTLASKTELVIGLDYPPSDKYFEGYNKIKDYIPTISGFKKVSVLTTEKNLNAANNTIRLKKYVRDLGYEKYIYSEDDNEFSPVFLEYMNWGLEKFKNSDEIYAICGYHLYRYAPMVSYEVYKAKSFCAWGYGTWFTKYDHIIKYYDFEKLKDLVNTSSIIDIFLPNKQYLIRNNSSLIGMMKSHYILGDSVTARMLIEEKMSCLFPSKSLVRNWGTDGSGMHGGSKEMLDLVTSIELDDRNCFEIENGDNIPFIEFKKRYIPKCAQIKFVYKLYQYLVFIFYKLGYFLEIKRVK